MHSTNPWENIKHSLFWQAGALVWSRKFKKYLAPAAGTNTFYSTAYDSVCMIDQDYKYKSDEEDLPHLHNPTLRPSFKQCVLSYLQPQEQQFMFDAFGRAHSAMLAHCMPSCYLSAVFISAPGTFFAPHIHSLQRNLTFTYVVGSNHTARKASTLIIDPAIGNGTAADKAYNIRLDYPDQNEFFMLLDTSMQHWTDADPEDQNFYMYIIFDDVVLRDPGMQTNHLYTI